MDGRVDAADAAGAKRSRPPATSAIAASREPPECMTKRRPDSTVDTEHLTDLVTAMVTLVGSPEGREGDPRDDGIGMCIDPRGGAAPSRQPDIRRAEPVP
jgi:hypothetical protein